MSGARTAAARDVQTILRITQNRQLKVDGIIGPETRSTYAQASGDAQRVVATVVKNHGLSMTDLLNPAAAVARPTSSKAPADVAVTIEKWCKVFGVSVKLATKICSIESAFNPLARSPTGASGLFQVTGSAVGDVRRHFTSLYYLPPGGDRYDIEWNVMVGVGYIKLSAGYAKVSPLSESVKDWAEIYSSYNIGPGAYRLWRAGQFSNSTLVDSWSAQSAELRRNGIGSYLSNVLTKMSSLA